MTVSLAGGPCVIPGVVSERITRSALRTITLLRMREDFFRRETPYVYWLKLVFLRGGSLSMGKTAVIIGAGPAGLTAGLELLRRTDIKPILLEASEEIGGISRTIKYKGNRMDIGGHRFFSKSDRVMEWWVELMPPDVGDTGAEPHENQAGVSYQGKKRGVAVPAHLERSPAVAGPGRSETTCA